REDPGKRIHSHYPPFPYSTVWLKTPYDGRAPLSTIWLRTTTWRRHRASHGRGTFAQNHQTIRALLGWFDGVVGADYHAAVPRERDTPGGRPRYPPSAPPAPGPPCGTAQGLGSTCMRQPARSAAHASSFVLRAEDRCSGQRAIDKSVVRTPCSMAYRAAAPRVE